MTKSFLFSTAAVLATVTAASAADLPSKKAAPVDYVKVCKVGDIAGFVIPGTDTCLKVGGFVRFQVDGIKTFAKNQNLTSYNAVGAIKLTAASQTDLGLLLAQFEIDGQSTGGTVLDSAKLALGGFAAGYFGSAYKFYDGGFGVGSTWSPGGAGNKPVQLQYAFLAGPATFTVALEDPSKQVSTALAPGGYAGARVPDVVAAIDANVGIATLHLGTVAHQMTNATGGVDGKWGYAVLGGVKAAFTPADTLYLESAYASGAITRLEGVATTVNGNAVTIGTDYVIDGTSIKPITGYYFLGAYQHAWAPNFSTFVSASYTVY
ncbi:porin, partial [Nostoc sp. NIES-2111]